MSMKILSPAGDMESLIQAVYNGADEVYLGVKDFNARNIEGFSLSTLKEAVDFAHIFGVKVNLTVNILFADEEMQSAVDLIVDAYNLGVDSFIIQDIGLASLIHKNYPQIEMHASTQMGLHNLEGVKAVEALGFKRVVLARETPIEEIKRIKDNTNVEIEYFCQGALCVSFSGNCYLSSYLNDASGNRGKCKQLCRLPYSFKLVNKELNAGYLLSAKDFNMLENLEDLASAGVDVLKIEGRARRPYYVGVATRVYKQALCGQKYNLDDLKLAFNRGYTAGYFNGNGEIISNKQNHIGLFIGRVEKFNKGKKFNEIFITSNRVISNKSVLKFLGVDEVVITAYDIQKKGELYRITTKQTVDKNSEVYLISDYQKEQELLTIKHRRKIDINITAVQNENIKAEFTLNGKDYVVLGDVCEVAKNQPMTILDLQTNFNKSEMFEAILNCKIDNIFIPKQKLNEFRRQVFERVKEVLTSVDRQVLKKIKLNKPNKIKEFENYQFIETLNETFEAKNIVYNPSEYKLQNIEEFINLCKKQNKKAYFNLPNFALVKDVEMLSKIVDKTKIAVIINNLYAFNFNTEKIVGGGINVYNNYTASYFNLPYIKAEGGKFKMPYMTLRHCPMKVNLKANCSNCPYKDGFYYVMQNGKKLKLKRIKMSSCTFILTD